eukprot:7387868-Prymnesium_polylepis.1
MISRCRRRAAALRQRLRRAAAAVDRGGGAERRLVARLLLCRRRVQPVAPQRDVRALKVGVLGASRVRGGGARAVLLLPLVEGGGGGAVGRARVRERDRGEQALDHRAPLVRLLLRREVGVLFAHALQARQAAVALGDAHLARRRRGARRQVERAADCPYVRARRPH